MSAFPGAAPAQGLLLVILAGILAGSGAAPIKIMRSYRYEHWALPSLALGLVILPWTATLARCPDALAAFASIDPVVILKANAFSAAWGVANLLSCLCLLRIGFSLTAGLMMGIGLPIGVLTPMVFRGTGLFADAPGLGSAAGHLILTGVAIMLVAVALVTLAGFGRDAARSGGGSPSGQADGGFRTGLIMAVLTGLLQAGLSFAFVYSQGPITDALRARGAGEGAAGIGVWAVTLPGGALVNLGYPLYLIRRDRSWGVFAARPFEGALTVAMGVSFFCFVAAMGQGMRLLGPLGASIGFGVQQASQISAAQAFGVVTGEWRGVAGRPRSQMLVALVLLLIAVVIMAAGRAGG